MKIGQNEIELHAWQFIVVAVIVLVMIGSCTMVALNRQKVEVEQVKTVAKEKTKRGHWLWGHWDDVAEKEEVTAAE